MRSLEPQELQLWVATVSGLVGLGGTLWQAYRYSHRPHLRVVRKYFRVISWKDLQMGGRTDYGVEVECLGGLRATNVRVTCDDGPMRFRGQLAEAGVYTPVGNFESSELVRLFSIRRDAVEVDTTGLTTVGASQVLLHASGGFLKRKLTVRVSSDNLEGSARRIKVKSLLKRARERNFFR